MKIPAELEFVALDAPDQLDQLLSDWQIHSTQIAGGRHRLINERILFPDLVIERTEVNVNKIDEYRIPADQTLFVLPKPGSPNGHWCGFEVSDEVLLINQSGRDYGAVLPAHHEAVTLLIPNEVLTVTDLLPNQAITSQALVRLANQNSRRFQNWLFGVFEDQESLAAISRDPATSTRIRSRVLYGLRQLLEQASWNGHSPRCNVRSYATVRAACREIRERIEEPLSVPQLASNLNVSQRMLERGFSQLLGVTPHQFIRVSKLNAVRRELRQTPRHQTTVSRTALKYGFTELGRFSVRYRQLFGEPPSETLNSGTRSF